jgi:hypothetical protein
MASFCATGDHKSVQGRTKPTVYSCFLDSSKAFDTVWIDGLFYKLYNIGIRETWRLLRNWYSNMSCYGLLDGLVSEAFPVKQGVRQGSVLSITKFRNCLMGLNVG